MHTTLPSQFVCRIFDSKQQDREPMEQGDRGLDNFLECHLPSRDTTLTLRGFIRGDALLSPSVQRS